MNEKPAPNRRKRQINIFYIILALWGILVLHNTWNRATQVAQIPYSQFQAYLAEGRVDEVQIDSKTVRGQLLDPEEGEPPRFVTVRVDPIPRGVAALGYTLRTPTEDRYLMTAAELEDKIAVLLGGRAAEELIYGDVSTGASDDLSKATDIAKSMVTQFGMSHMLGKASLEKPRQAYLQGDSNVRADYSEETAREIDTEVRRILDQQYERALAILRDHSIILRNAARVLLDKETITGEELEAIRKTADLKVFDQVREVVSA